MVEKNLSGHGRRNAKTSILFTICVSFIIFSGTVFNQQEATLVAKAKVWLNYHVTTITRTKDSIRAALVLT